MSNDVTEPKTPETTDDKRRRFLMNLSLGLGGVAALAAGIPVLGALFAPLLADKPEAWRDVGAVEGFPVKSTRLVKFKNAAPQSWGGVSAHTAAWLRRETEEQFVAFSVNCTHLGCPVRWEEEAHLFMCPCHGGVYYKDGTVAAGPPPKPLTRYQVRVQNGQVQIKTAPLPLTKITA